MDFSDKSVDELMNIYRTLENVDRYEGKGTKKEIRKELFRRGVDNINGVPMEILLRNPVIKEEYESVQGEIT